MKTDFKDASIAFILSSAVYVIFVSILILILYWQIQPFTYSYEPAWATVVSTNRDHKEILDYEYIVDGKKYLEGIHNCRGCEVGNLKRIYYRAGNPAVTFNSEPSEIFASAFFAAAIGLFVFPTIVTLIFCFHLSGLTKQKADAESVKIQASLQQLNQNETQPLSEVPNWMKFANYFTIGGIVSIVLFISWMYAEDAIEHGFNLADFLVYLAITMFILGKLIFHQILIKNADKKDHSWAKKVAITYYFINVLLYVIARNVHNWLK